ncbi:MULTISPECIES: REP-associated tyrosine transposase [Pseudomonas]|uniref:Transposase n=1 Tax=Pseudomonas izuensis TaxID=2684212 RepID=A0ABM7RSL5_9PSED|nr:MULTISPECIES: transposase [Pseudomonas]RKS12457.1 REP element-mobilizing transposase RayT [Pseudomonas sp. WPR_5_2]BCX65491.1 transposase [Pseudomonas izuensis]
MPSQHQSHRLRSGRYSEEGQIYLLTVVVNNRQPVLSGFEAGRLVVDAFRKAQQEQSANSLAFVVMPDHFHWLIELKSMPLRTLMGRTKSRTTVALNRLLQREGSLWQSGFHDRAIRKEEDLQAVARYIVANPLRAGLVDKVGDYPLWDAIWL